MIKFCVDCRFYFGNGYMVCSNHKVNRNNQYFLVSKDIEKATSCENARHDSGFFYRTCGPRGRYYESSKG